jgi:hypothetical protein
VDGGNVYAAGYQGTGSFDYGGYTVAGPTSENVVLVKYNAAGVAQWAKTVTGIGLDASKFNAVAVDGAGNVYAAGYQTGTGSYRYGTTPLVEASGASSSSNVVLVKYDASGNALWAKTVTTGSTQSMFEAVAVDGAGNVYAAGCQQGTGYYRYGTTPLVEVSGASSLYNVVLVKYDPSGNAQWAKTVTTGSNNSYFYAVAVDGGAVYAAGRQYGTGSYTYGTTPLVETAGASFFNNVVLVKYDTSGTAQWARTVAGSNSSMFSAAALGGSAIYAAGSQQGMGLYDYGDGKTAAGGSSGNNVALVKYPRD